ncbi:leukocyte surface antigen CD47 isoform X2 [Dermochelys coriacea]|uniref:leukocyte surface antigen CD47 isoform X2 n=1 Tax=Dermochelys coriacea TaxID=27794 RepID=UPI0018E81F7C|nr:leukocyte surface antigen CD47 isoform X2 [Dermochelys coriacea]
MWALGAWVLLGAVGAGSAQLQFSAVKSVEQTMCNKTVILPCIVTNLVQKNIKDMFVKWKLEKKEFFSFDGNTEKTIRNNNFSSAVLESVQNLNLGIASLTISKTQAVPGNYSCEVTESNREGETVIELVYRVEPWFPQVESILIILSLVLAILLYWIQLGVTVSKETTSWGKIGLIIAGIILSVVAAVGFILLVPDGFEPKNQAGLGLIVLPAVILVPLQYFLLKIAFKNNLPVYKILVVVLESVGYLIAVIGFALCITACPSKNGAVVIAGLAIMALTAVVGLIYVSHLGFSKKDQPPRKAVEEPFNG